MSIQELVLDGTTILANARAVAPVLEQEADDNERRAQLNARTVEALRSTGVFRLSMPKAWGGPEVDLGTQIEVIETLARADGSAGWCATIGGDAGFYTARLDDDAGRSLYPSLDAVTAGFIQPIGRLDTVAGGYRLSGRWPFGSGCTHADVIVAGATVMDHGEPVIGTDGFPEWRIAMLPADRYEILHTWDTMGLRGTGSHDFRIDDAFVPTEYTFSFRDRPRAGALYAWPGLFLARLAGVSLGIAGAALAAAETTLADKLLVPEMRPARDDARVRSALARAEAIIGSARSYVYDVVGDFWAMLQAGSEPSRRQRAAIAGANVHTAGVCRDAVQLLADTIGSASIHRRSPLERHQRDIITAAQHVLNQPRFLEAVGALWLEGADTNSPRFSYRLL
jgi:alkylation response protein AidB-like acyl-CoA dehydrogenase